LYTWRVEGDEDMLAGAIRLVGLESPALSPALTSLLSNDNPVVASKLREAILGISDYEPFEHLFELAKLLTRSTSVVDGFSGTSLEAPPTGGQGLRMVATCELLLTSKSNYFVVNDLRELAKQDDDVPNGSILGAILDPAAFDEPFDEMAEREAIVAFTELVALLILNAMEATERGRLAAELQGALDSRVVIEQAKGVLVGRHGLTTRQAFERLRRQARDQRRPLTEVARGVVSAAEHR